VQRTLGADIDDEFIAELKGAHAANQVGGIFIIEELVFARAGSHGRACGESASATEECRNAAREDSRRARLLIARCCQKLKKDYYAIDSADACFD